MVRPAFLSAVFSPALRRWSNAASTSPWVELRARLQSISGAPERSRRSCTIFAVISMFIAGLGFGGWIVDPAWKPGNELRAPIARGFASRREEPDPRARGSGRLVALGALDALEAGH